MAPPKLQSRMSTDLPRLPFQMDMLRLSLLMLLHQVIEKNQSWQKISCRVATTWIQSLCGRGDTQLGRSLGEVQGQDLSEDPGS